MAELVKKETGETLYTITLTETEVATLYAAMGVTDEHMRSESFAARQGFKLLKDGHPLYQFLCYDVLGVER